MNSIFNHRRRSPNLDNIVVPRIAKMRFQKVGKPSDDMRGKRREYAKASAKKLAKRIMREKVEHDRMVAKGLDKVLNWPGPTLRFMESCNADLSPHFYEKDHHNCFMNRMRLNAHIVKYIDNIPDVEYVRVVDELFIRLPDEIKFVLRETLAEINPLNSSELREIESMNKTLGGGKLAFESLKKTRSMEPQMRLGSLLPTVDLGISSTVEGLSSSISGAADTIANALREFGSSVSNVNIGHKLDVNFGITTVIGNVIRYILSFPGESFTALATGALWLLLDTANLVSKTIRESVEATIKIISEYFTPTRNLVPQAGGDSKKLSAVILTWLPYLFGLEFAKVFAESYFIKAVELVDLAVHDYAYTLATFTGFLTMLKSCLSHLLSLVGLDRFAVMFTAYPSVYKAKKVIDMLSEKMEGGRYIPCFEDAQAAKESLSELNRDLEAAIKSKSIDAANIRDIRSRLEKLNVTASAGFKNDRYRQPPTTLCLVGLPGKGKTHSVEQLAPLLAIYKASNEQLNKLESMAAGSLKGIYYQNGVSSFYDGYTGDCSVIVNDEFMAIKDTGAGAGAAIEEFTSAVNSAPHHPQMAVATDKGNVTFEPSFMLLSTNVKKLTVDELRSFNDTTAVTRRLDIVLEVDIPPEFQNEHGRVDPDKAAEANDGTPLYSPCQFFHYDINTGRRLPGPAINLQDVYDLVTRHHDEAGARHRANLQQRLNARDHFVALRRRALEPQMGTGEIPDVAPPAEGDLRSSFERMRSDAAAMFSAASKRVAEEARSGLDTIYSAMSSNLPCVTLVSGILSALGMIIAITSRYETLKPHSVTIEPKGKSIRPVVRRRRGALNKAIKPQSGDVAAMNIINAVLENVYEVFIAPLVPGKRSLQPSMRRGYSTCIGGTVHVVPKHFYYLCEGIYSDYLSAKTTSLPYVEFKPVGSTGSGFIIPVDQACTYFVFDSERETVDKAYFAIPPSDTGRSIVKPRRNITHHMLSDARSGEAWFVNPRSVGPVIQQMSMVVDHVPYLVGGDTWLDGGHGLSYNLNTSKGDCGALIFTRDDAGVVAWCGIHTAGYDRGFGGHASGFSGTFDEVMWTKASDIKPRFDGLPRPLRIKEASGFSGNMHVIGECPKTPAPSSKIVVGLEPYIEESGKWPVSLKPFLVDGVIVDPAKGANDKYSQSCVVIDTGVLQTAANVVANTIKRQTRKHYPVSWISADEAIGPIGNIPMMKRSSSPGMEVSAVFGVSDKVSIMGSEGAVDTNAPNHEAFMRELNAKVKLILDGKPYTTIFKDFTKDEVIDKTKALTGKARKVSGSCMYGNAITRMAYGHFINTYIDPENIINNESAVGINPFSTDWGRIARKAGDNVMYTDFSAFDSGLGVQLLESVFDVIDSVSPTDNKDIIKLREWVRSDTIHSVHAFDGKVLEWAGSNPSGNVLTTLINNIAQSIIFQLTITRALLTDHRHVLGLGPARPREAFVDLEETYDQQFETDDATIATLVRGHFNLTLFGDDGLIGLSDTLSSCLTTKDLAVAAGYYGWTITNGDKTDPRVNPTRASKISKATFLKRGFSRVGDRWVAPLDMRSISQSLAFSKKGSNDEKFQQVIDNACREWSLHGEEVYNREVVRLTAVIASTGRALHIPYLNYADAFVSACNSDVSMWAA